MSRTNLVKYIPASTIKKGTKLYVRTKYQTDKHGIRYKTISYIEVCIAWHEHGFVRSLYRDYSPIGFNVIMMDEDMFVPTINEKEII